MHSMLYISLSVLFSLHPSNFEIVFSFLFSSNIFFKCSFWDFFFDPSVVWKCVVWSLFNFIGVCEQTLYDLYSFTFVKICFMAWNAIYLSECSMWAWEEYVFCYCQLNLSIDVNYIQWIDGAVEFNISLLIFCLLD